MKVSWLLSASLLLAVVCITSCASTNGTAELVGKGSRVAKNAPKSAAGAPKESEKSHKGGQRLAKQIKSDAKTSDSRVVVSTVKPNKKTRKAEKTELICPKNPEKHVGWFALPCTNDKSCLIMGKKHVCCKVNSYKRCIQGVPKSSIPLRNTVRNSIVFLPQTAILGLIQQRCPQTPLAELFWELKTCDTDADCWPRVCCPDGQKKYCRSATVELQKSDIPFARSLANPLEAMSGYIQCTPPPAPSFDLFPKPCNNTLDCFPNVCCQEKGRKHCRPPKRSLLALLTTMTQNVSAQWLKEWASNLVIP
ncbi:uncharacterized protein LOC132261527 [Phlebotomus argentipes]|uniref:uncharacterized protein LOC132261527 n=1 Tax=Phlebotomus argentipes TaxID=94469 RepID=UPI0028932FBD|nr:uncharacterized protein LOC132261527 [Phlebotomus argentipes]